MSATMTTGYETYTQKERDQLIADYSANLRDELRNVDVDGLRGEIARSNVREFQKQIERIKNTN